MILHQGDRYVCNGTQVHPGSLNFLKSSLEIGVCYNQDAVVLFRLSNLGAFVFEFILDAVIIKSAVVFAPIRYFYFTPPTAFRIFHYTEKMLWKKRLFWVKR